MTRIVTEAETFLKERGFDPRKMNGRIFHANFEGLMDAHQVREDHIGRFGFAVLTGAIIEVIRPYAPLVEVGAGTGYWSHELRKAGVDVIATDPCLGKYGGTGENWHGQYGALERIHGVTAVRKYPDRNLLMVWPDYNGKWCARVLKEFRGRVVLYVGEIGGCTGSGEFHTMLNEHFTNVRDVSVPQFRGIHDRLTVWERKDVTQV